MGKRLTIFFFLTLLLAVSACKVNHEALDQSYIAAASKNSLAIKEAAELALLLYLENHLARFEVSDVTDRDIRNKLYKAGSSVNIVFYDFEGADSVVCFKTLSLRNGTQEIIYDIAARERDLTRDPAWPSFIRRIADRIYYVRRPFPIM